MFCFEQETFNTDFPTVGEKTFELIDDLPVRRVRIVVLNYTGEPCFRFELLGCNATESLVPVGISDPVLTFNYASMDDLSLTCTIQDLPTRGIQYYLTWWKDGEGNLTSEYVDQDMSSVLDVKASELVNDFRIFKYQCFIEPCYKETCSLVRGMKKSSNFFQAEIQLLSEDSLSVVENGPPALIQFKSTVPPSVFCQGVNADPACLLTVKVKSQNEATCLGGTELPQVVFPESASSQESCFVTVTQDNWNTVHDISVVGSIDGIIDGNRQTTVSLETRANQKLLLTLGLDIQVSVEDKDTAAVCSSLAGPHLTTFDGVKYDNQNEGEFVFYKHDTLPLEIHMFYRRCGQNDFNCNCGVSVLVDNDVLVIDRCGAERGSDPTYPVKTQMYVNGGMASSFRVASVDSGREFHVYLPTGGELVVQPSYKGNLNVWFYPSLLDFNNTSGLCGVFDEQDVNDFQHSDNASSVIGDKYPVLFTLSWRYTTL
ncbi:von Willebrand factor D and EGF domain-containing protein-like [Pecten maximus]|uniref:von Willebrand factor D and EGF domain-containing protein-like n=1 Tax=Pecten maximus TaxID=6579 RepID=UPI0014591A3B|nr:von Willebrand factor D and EGF domain-containing protein-like [Pecten maximus]